MDDFLAAIALMLFTGTIYGLYYYSNLHRVKVRVRVLNPDPPNMPLQAITPLLEIQGLQDMTGYFIDERGYYVSGFATKQLCTYLTQLEWVVSVEVM